MLCPSDENELRQAMTTAFQRDQPVAVRYPRGAGAGAEVRPELTAWPWGRGVQRRSGRRIAILAFGTLLHPALAAAERLDASVADMRFAKPLDTELLLQLARTHEALVTVEEGCLPGGAGSAVLEALAAAGVQIPVLNLGLPDVFVEHGDPARVMSNLGLDAAGIEQSITRRFGATLSVVKPAINA